MEDLQHIPEGLVSKVSQSEACVLTLPFSSYWTWAVLVFLVICSQSLSFIEKYWVKVRDLSWLL